VLHDVCLRDGALAERDLAVESRFKNFVENPSHFYYWSEGKKDHPLGVPQPFRNNGSWTPIPFSPIISDCSDRLATQLYFGIYSREKAKNMANIYMTPPSEWEAATHPCTPRNRFRQPKQTRRAGTTTLFLLGPWPS
jgi:hypothetical protein